jgi:hypothetical protein
LSIKEGTEEHLEEEKNRGEKEEKRQKVERKKLLLRGK